MANIISNLFYVHYMLFQMNTYDNKSLY